MATIISVASGKGGVGKSVVASNLALALAKRGFRVVLTDLDVGGADSHILFGLLNPPLTLTDFLSRRVERLDEIVQPLPVHPGLILLPGTGDTLTTANMPYATKKRLIRHLTAMDADVIVADIGAGTGYHALDFFLMADYHLAVATPDPTSVLDLYRFIKLAAIRRVLSFFLTRDAMAEALSSRDFVSVEEVLAAAGQANGAGVAVVETALRTFHPLLVVNRSSSRSRVNVLGLRNLLNAYVGGDLSLLGEIPDDPAVERSVRSFLPVLETEPRSPAAQALHAVADALTALMNQAPAAQGALIAKM